MSVRGYLIVVVGVLAWFGGSVLGITTAAFATVLALMPDSIIAIPIAAPIIIGIVSIVWFIAGLTIIAKWVFG